MWKGKSFDKQSCHYHTFLDAAGSAAQSLGTRQFAQYRTGRVRCARTSRIQGGDLPEMNEFAGYGRWLSSNGILDGFPVTLSDDGRPSAHRERRRILSTDFALE